LICDQWVQFEGDAEERDANGGFLNLEFARTGIHSHNDGVIHWHPNSRAAVGRRAKLEVFLDVYGLELETGKMTFSEEQRSQLPAGYEDGVFEDGETTCTIDGEEQDGALQVVVWDNFTDTDAGTTFIAAYNNIPIDQDAMVFSIAFVPDNTDVSMPPWAADLPTLGTADSGQQLPDGQLFGGTTVPGEDVPTITAGESGNTGSEIDDTDGHGGDAPAETTPSGTTPSITEAPADAEIPADTEAPTEDTETDG
jgi:hypothetical protein